MSVFYVFTKYNIMRYSVSAICTNLPAGAQLEGDLGKILTLKAKILPYICLREKWEST